MHKVMSKELDDRFRDTELLSKLAVGDLIALESKYHSSCAVMYRNRVRSNTREKKTPPPHNITKYEQLAFLHLVSDIEKSRYDTDFQTSVLSNSVKEYDPILKHFGHPRQNILRDSNNW